MITTEDASSQLHRAEQLLERHVGGIERHPGLLTVTFDADAPSNVIDEFIEMERGCCSFLSIQRDEPGETTRVVFASDDSERQAALAVISDTLDPDQAAVGAKSGERGKRGALIGALGLACLACCLPPLLAAGAAGSLVATFAGTGGIFAGLAVFLTLAATFAFTRRRRRTRPAAATADERLTIHSWMH